MPSWKDYWMPLRRRGEIRFSHVMHPRYVQAEWADLSRRADIHFFRDHLRQRMPAPDLQLLTSLEQVDLPTIHNMILGDRVVRETSYDDALKYATFLARRLIDLFRDLTPDVIVGGFDSIHGGLALAVARYLKIPWFALHFSVIPGGPGVLLRSNVACREGAFDRAAHCGPARIRGSSAAEIREQSHSGAGIYCAASSSPFAPIRQASCAIVGPGTHAAKITATRACAVHRRATCS